MEKEYQNGIQNFIEKQFESYNSKSIKIYNEEYKTEYDSILQEYSPLIGGKLDDNLYNELKEKFNIVGLRDKIKEFNFDSLNEFIKKHNIKKNIEEILELIFLDFKEKYLNSNNEVELYQLIFVQNQYLNDSLKRKIFIDKLTTAFEYNVIYYEDSNKYLGKNSFYMIRERRIPIKDNEYKKSERPDFLYYINGIPLVLIEYKTEYTGILKSLKDFENKKTYNMAPFKIATNDGRDVIFFSDLKFLKYKNGKDNSFKWVYYFNEKKYKKESNNEFTNIEYFMDELICQPENMYIYSIDCCSVVNKEAHSYLINSRIQQYYAIKSIRKSLINVLNNVINIPYNFEFSHTQRSGKTILMKLISYLIERYFQDIFNIIFIYTPDLQIKDVVNNELSKLGATKTIVKMIESRSEYRKIINNIYKNEKDNKDIGGIFIYIVNMQKITNEDFILKDRVVINNNKILNIIDEAHYGQTKEMAEKRQNIFPNSSNYLFTATGKNDMYAYYFPDNNKKGYSDKFTFSNALKCNIVVPVKFLQEKKIFDILNDKLIKFSENVENRVKENYVEGAKIINEDIENLNIDEYTDISNKKIVNEIKNDLKIETIPEKIEKIINFMNNVRIGLFFSPKAIVYVDSIEIAKNYIEYIQQIGVGNNYKNYHFGVDFSSMDNCEQYNPEINEQEQISVNFQKNRDTQNVNENIIDILFVVDKYQKGFDLPSLLVTFLDVKISEPSKMNQIFTRSATKFENKNTGYCVDLTNDIININSFKQSLVLYNDEDNSDNFIDDGKLKEINRNLRREFNELIKLLELNNENFTSNMILEKLLNEKIIENRNNKQYSFFYISKNIFSNLRKIGSPLFFKPFNNEIKVLTESFLKFKEIYADKNHIDHNKISINTDNTFNNNIYITKTEIKDIIKDGLMFIEEYCIKDIIRYFDNSEYNEINIENDDIKKIKEELIKKSKQENRVNNIENNFNNIKNYLEISHKNLYDLIIKEFTKISNDRTIIYSEITQEELNSIEKDLKSIRDQIEDEIHNKFNDNPFLYWSNQIINSIFEKYNIEQPNFINIISKEIYEDIKTILSQIDNKLSNYEKTKLSIEYFNNKECGKKVLGSLKYSKGFNFDNNFKEQLQKATEMNNGIPILSDADLFNKYLIDTLKLYYQYIEKKY